MDYINKLTSFFDGKKTYIIGILLVILGVLQNENQTILEGIGLMTLRSGVEKTLK